MPFPPSVLADGVVTLRPLELVDARAHLAGEDEELIRWLNGGPGTPERVEAHVRRCMDSWEAGGPTFTFGIRAGTEGLLVGTIDVRLEHEELVSGQAQLAYGLYPEARGRGFATRAVMLACRFAAALPDVAEAVIRVDPRNPASAGVAVRAGFRYVGHRIEVREGSLDWYVRGLLPPIDEPGASS
jgi:RimJ/RimL family protein N-acetyltransferase